MSCIVQRLLDRAYCGKGVDRLCEEAAEEIKRLQVAVDCYAASSKAAAKEIDALKERSTLTGQNVNDTDRGDAEIARLRLTDAEREQANHDAVPAAIAFVGRPRTDKADLPTRDGAGNTDARLAALDELELEYGLTGNPMIKVQQRTPPTQTTPGECSRPQEGT